MSRIGKLGEFVQKDGKVFKVVRKWDTEVGNIQEYFVNGGKGAIIENAVLKDYTIVSLPYITLYPERAEALCGKLRGSSDLFVVVGSIDEELLANKRKSIVEKFKIDPTEIIFYLVSEERDEDSEPEYLEDPMILLRAEFNRVITEQEINDEIEEAINE